VCSTLKLSRVVDKLSDFLLIFPFVSSHPELRACLVQVSNEGQLAFLEAEKSMDMIDQKSRVIGQYVNLLVIINDENDSDPTTDGVHCGSHV
jgi:hypothetical protein